MEDRDIISLYFARNEDAIKESSDKYGKYVTGISMSILQNALDAEECVNDTWLKAWNSIPPQNPPSLKVYLGRLVRHLSIDRLRTITRLKRNREYEVALDELADCALPEEEDVTALTAALDEFLEGLEPTRPQALRGAVLAPLPRVQAGTGLRAHRGQHLGQAPPYAGAAEGASYRKGIFRMKASTTILRGLNNIRASYILESELPDTAAVLLPPSDRRTAWKKITSNGWFVAAVCAVVAFGTLTGIVLAGRGGPGGITPPVGSQPTDTTAEQTEAPTEGETEPAVVYTEGLEFAPIDGEEGACYVAGIGKAKDRRIRIPETSPEGLTVKYIGQQAFAYNMDITEVILPDTVEFISDYAFVGCMSLKKVTVGEGLTSVKTYAFYQCTKLKDINLTTNHEIQTSAMYGTPWLDAHTDEFVIYGGNLIDYNGAGGDVVVPDGVKRIYGHAFADKTNITSVTIPDSCEWVAGAVFMNCSSLESLSIPSSVIAFGGERLFEGCTSLHTLDLPGVLEIVPWAFRDTTSITEVHMPNVQIIGYEAFKNCAGLTRFETAAQIIAYGCFADCKNLRELVFLDGVQKLDDDFFKNCPALERIVLPSTVTAIGHISAISSEDLVIEYAGTAEDFAKIQMDEQTAALLLPYVQFTVSE